MSTILKALKTLETESGSDTEMALAPVAARGIADRLASKRRHHAWRGILILLVLGTALGLYHWQAGPMPPTKTAGQPPESKGSENLPRSAGPDASVGSSGPPPAQAPGRQMAGVLSNSQAEAKARSGSAGAKHPKAEDQPEPGRTRQSAAEGGLQPNPESQADQRPTKTARVGKAVSSASQKPLASGRETVARSSAPSVKPSPASGKSDTDPDSKRVRPPAGQQATQEQAPDAAGRAAQGGGNESNAVKQPSLPVFKNTGLEIQALSWNQNPENRIAVINSRLCREGDRVGSYRIVSINPDDVVVARGESRGRVVITRH